TFCTANSIKACLVSDFKCGTKSSSLCYLLRCAITVTFVSAPNTFNFLCFSPHNSRVEIICTYYSLLLTKVDNRRHCRVSVLEYGYTEEYFISRVLLDFRILNVFEGTGEIQAQIISRRLLDGNRTPEN
ncbi:MAG TPA: acyl-CoA dehydrogenase, partial [Alphaproteobacteria bacterium]|nr:acyl-CoA dehydrogenase [Alphaproteobacteria bacterium]